MNAKQSLLRRFEPAGLLFNLNLSAKVWFGMFLFMSLALMVSLIASLFPRKASTESVIVVGANGEIYQGGYQHWTAVTNLHIRTAELATQALLLRSPAGFDIPGQLDLLYLPEAAARAREQCDGEAADRLARELRQKPEIFDLRYLRLSNERIRVTVRGEVVQAGFFSGQPIVHAIPFQLDLELIRNPNLALSGLAPFVVRHFIYETPQR